MGFFSKLFGGNEEKKADAARDLPLRKAVLSGQARFRLAEILEPQHRALLNERMRIRKEARLDPGYCSDPDADVVVDEMDARYEFDLEYVVFDEALRAEIIGDDDMDESLNELFRINLSEHNEITVKAIEGRSAEYANDVLEQFNYACRDWGVEGKRLALRSVVPTDAYREFYAAYRGIWTE